MSKRYSGKSFKDSSVMKKPKLSLKENSCKFQVCCMQLLVGKRECESK